MIEAVWNPPAHSTGTSTDCLTARASSRLIPSTPSLRTRRSHAHAKPLLIGRRAEHEVVPERVLPAREHRVVGADHVGDGELPRGVARVREEVAGGDVQPVDAGLDQPLADLDRLLEGRPLLAPGEERLAVVDRADLELEVEVVPDLLAHRAHDLEREARAVLERPAVVVGAVVDRGGEELRDQVAVAAVDLDPVELRPRARGARPARRSRRPRRSAPSSSARTGSRGPGPACPWRRGPCRRGRSGCRAAGRRRPAGRCTWRPRRGRASPARSRTGTLSSESRWA